MSALGRVLGVALALGMNPALAELHNESRRRAELRDERIRAEQLAARVRGDEVIDGAYLVDAAAEDADLPEPTQASAFWRHLSPFVDAPHGVILDVPAVLMPGQRTVAKLRGRCATPPPWPPSRRAAETRSSVVSAIADPDTGSRPAFDQRRGLGRPDRKCSASPTTI